MKGLGDVSLWFAKDMNGRIITIDKANKNNKYICPICGSEVIPKALDSDKVTEHFAHIDRSECGGETIVHWWTKNNLLKAGDVFSVFTTEEKQYLCKDIKVEQVYDTPFGKYIPDATIECYNGEIIFLEVNVTNKKNVAEYYDKWKHLGKQVIEFNINNVYDMDNLEIRISNRFKAIYYEGYKPYVRDKKYVDFKNDILEKVVVKKEYKEEQLNDIEWFIDDLYEYKVNKEEYKLDAIINEISYIKDTYTYEHTILVEDIMKKKCNSVVKDIVTRKDNLFYKTIKEYMDSLGFEYEIKAEKFEDTRYVYDRLNGYVYYYIIVFFKFPYEMWREIDGICGYGKYLTRRMRKEVAEKEYSLKLQSCDDLKSINKLINVNELNEIKRIIANYIEINDNIKNNIHPISDEYPRNLKTYLIDLIKQEGWTQSVEIKDKMAEKFANTILNYEFNTLKINNIEYVDLNKEVKLTNKIKDEMRKQINKIYGYSLLSKMIKENKGDGFNPYDISYNEEGLRFNINWNTEIRIDNIGNVIINNHIVIASLGSAFLENVEESVELIINIFKKGVLSNHTSESIKNINKLKNIYTQITNTKYEVVCTGDKVRIKKGATIIAEVEINKEWEQINKEVSDKVRNYIYG